MRMIMAGPLSRDNSALCQGYDDGDRFASGFGFRMIQPSFEGYDNLDGYDHYPNG